MELRHLTPADIPGILTIQQDAYRPELLERAETFLSKMSLFPAGCIGLWDKDELNGYIFSHPWDQNTPIPLDSPIKTLPDSPICYYIHDLAIHSRYRNHGVATYLLQNIVDLTQKLGLPQINLVAVQASEKFWTRHGFTTIYQLNYHNGVTASFMTMRLNL
jgi:GNAT superfamily N-acetyltransferase